MRPQQTDRHRQHHPRLCRVPGHWYVCRPEPSPSGARPQPLPQPQHRTSLLCDRYHSRRATDGPWNAPRRRPVPVASGPGATAVGARAVRPGSTVPIPEEGAEVVPRPSPRPPRAGATPVVGATAGCPFSLTPRVRASLIPRAGGTRDVPQGPGGRTHDGPGPVVWPGFGFVFPNRTNCDRTAGQPSTNRPPNQSDLVGVVPVKTLGL